MKTESKQKLGAAKWSIYVNIFIIIIKLAAGIYTGSIGIIAEFIHSFFDLLASLFAYIGIKQAAIPPDKSHHYGHDRFENFSSFLQSFLIALTALFIIYESYQKITTKEHIVTQGIIGIIVMIITFIIDYKIAHYLHHKSIETGSPALEADAYHFTTDLLSTAAVILGLIATMAGYPIADVIAAIIVAFVMLYISLRLGKKAIVVMLDQAPDEQTTERIAQCIAQFPNIKGYHALRARTAGNRIFIDVKIHLSNDLTLKKAHEIADQLEMELIDKFPDIKEAVIHMEPEDHAIEPLVLKSFFD